MKRARDDHNHLVYAYGCSRPIACLEHALAQQERCRAFWDRLLDIEERHEVAVLAAASEEGARLIFLRDEIWRVGALRGACFDERSAQRKAARAKLDTPELEARIAKLSSQRKALRGEFFALLANWRKAHPETMREFEARRGEAVAEARRSSGLYWGSYNRVLASYQAALRTVRKTGRRRLRRSDPERAGGCLALQIQRTISGLVAAACEWIERGGGSGFAAVSPPRGATRFQQAIGRLVRSVSDWGEVIVLDRRLASSAYGKRMLAPVPMRVLVA